MSRATSIASATAGMPGRPRRVASSPSVAAPPAASEGSSGCTTTRTPKPRAYDSASRISRALPIARIPSVNATAPASRSSPSSASCSPRHPDVSAP